MTPTQFLESLESSMAMKPADWLEEQINTNSELVIIDLRDETKFSESKIIGSVQCDIKKLPTKVTSLISSKNKTVVMVCNGSIQSAMAVMFLRCEGYKNSFNLGGGFSSWVDNERAVE